MTTRGLSSVLLAVLVAVVLFIPSSSEAGIFSRRSTKPSYQSTSSAYRYNEDPYSDRAYVGNLDQRLMEARYVFQEFTQLPENGIPRGFVQKARVILIFPNQLRGGWFYGGKFGLGVALVRDEETGEWSPPAFMRYSGGTFGLQFGAQWSDTILIGKGDASLVNFLQSKLSVGGSASATAGPFGRHTEFDVDWPLKSSLFAYSRSRGLYLGVALDGSVISFDKRHNEMYYGRGITGADVLFGDVVTRTRNAELLVQSIDEYADSVTYREPAARLAEPRPRQASQPVVQTQVVQESQPIVTGYPRIVDETDNSILLVKNIVKNIRIYFDYNSAELRPDAVGIMDKAVDVLASNPELSIVISGHTDIRGSQHYNERLGLERAERIRQFMAGSGIVSDRIKIISRGELDALAPPTDLSGMQRDRQASFIIAELVKQYVAVPPPANTYTQAIGKTLYMTREELNIESDVKVATREYTVRPGDTLWNISQRELGNPHRWKHIYAINMQRIQNPDSLVMGQTLLIPVE